MTAVASISTSHSGLASACTTRPVQTGCTPFIYSPPVDRLAMADVGDIDHQLDDMRHLAAGLGHELADVLHYLVGLLGGVVAVDVLRVIQVLGALATHPHGFSALRDNRLAKVVVEILFGI